MIGKIRKFIKRLLKRLFLGRRIVKLGVYGAPNSGKTTLANRICREWYDEEIGKVSKIPHETRTIASKEPLKIKFEKRTLTFSLIDTPGIATMVDYEDFVKYGISARTAKKRAREATQGVIESIKLLDTMDVVIVIVDSTKDPFSQVNITIIGNLAAREIPIQIVANKIDLRRSKIEAVQNAFPEYDVVGVSARYGRNMDKFYKSLLKTVES